MHSCIITPVGITQYHCVLRGGTAIQRTADKMLESIQLKAPTTDMMDKCERCETRSTAMEIIGPYATSALATTPSHVIPRACELMRGARGEGGRPGQANWLRQSKELQLEEVICLLNCYCKFVQYTPGTVDLKI